MRRRSLLLIFAVLAFLGLLTYGLVSKGSSGPQIGDVAPTNTLQKLEGEGNGSLADLRGQWVLVNIWASWCEPCRAESPALEDLQKRYGGKNFTVLGIDTRDSTDDGVAFVEEFQLTYPQLRDGDGSEAHAWGTTGVPESFLVDPEGILRVIHRGPIDEDLLKERFIPVFTGPSPKSEATP